jgi:hypothetical protein
MVYKRHLRLPKRTILNTDINEWKADDHTPAFYAKTIVDKIFATKGYKYTDDSFFTSDRFKRLIVPFGIDKGINFVGANATNDTNWTFTNTASYTADFQQGDVIKVVAGTVEYVDSNGITDSIAYGSMAISANTYFFNGSQANTIKYNETVDFGFLLR